MIRHPYRAKFRLVQGSAEEFWVSYYYALPTANLLPYPSILGARVWEQREQEHTGGGLGPVDYKRYPIRGRNQGQQGKCFQGDPSWLLMGVPPAAASTPQVGRRCCGTIIGAGWYGGAKAGGGAMMVTHASSGGLRVGPGADWVAEGGGLVGGDSVIMLGVAGGLRIGSGADWVAEGGAALGGDSVPTTEGGLRVGGDSVVSCNCSLDINVSSPSRSLNTVYSPSSSEHVLLQASVSISSNNATGRIWLKADSGGTPSTVRGMVSSGPASGGGGDQVGGMLIFLLPPGWSYKLETSTTTGSPGYSLDYITETSIGLV